MASGAWSGLVTWAVDADGVAVVTFNSPSTLNALTQPMGRKFKSALGEIARRADVRCVVLTGAGRAFSAGGDLDFLNDRAFNSTPETNTNAMREFYAHYLQPLTECTVPTIAAINGHAIGAAFALALAADMRVISTTAKLSVNFTKLGLHPGMGSTFVLPRTVRREVAALLLLTGRQITGEEAMRYGLCLEAVPASDVLAQAMSIAKEIASNGRLAVVQTKESLDAQWMEGMDRQLRREADAQAVSFVGTEFRDRLAALQHTIGAGAGAGQRKPSKL